MSMNAALGRHAVIRYVTTSRVDTRVAVTMASNPIPKMGVLV